ncbi:MAG: hypothetical protein JWP13_222 [Candidatus Saccharibacteria bacterium]|nr:hypothetical protein [Candidatus Saccharibacteria bacterium]
MDYTEQLKNYIKDQLGAGLSPDEIVAQLVNAGWPQEYVHQGFQAVQAEVVPSTYPATAQAPTQRTQPAPQTEAAGSGRILPLLK